MSPDLMEDLEISLAVRVQCEKRREAERDPQADISIYVPFGIMGPQDYAKADISDKTQ